jgi:AraC-like DNA-binding protein
MKEIPIRNINTILKELGSSGDFLIRDARDLLSEGDMVQELHRHNFFYILALEKGDGEHSIDFMSYPVKDHTVFIMRPGQVHKITLKSKSKGYLMQFNSDFYSPIEKTANQIFRKVTNGNFFQLDPEAAKKTFSILNEILREYANKQENHVEVIKSSLHIFFIELLRQSPQPQHPSQANGEYMQERLMEFMELVRLHITTHKQVAFYVEKLHLTAYQLNAITKATLDKTCSEVINDYIILEAKRYLLATSNQINQIAWQLGYEDVSYFIRFFRKHTGHSPEAFRHNFR